MFGIFGRGRAKQPPLTEYCRWLSEPANLLKAANQMATEARPSRLLPLLSADEELRGSLLYSAILGAAGKFDLRGDALKGVGWEGLRHYFRDTNLDVITAEAIVWVHFLLWRLFVADDQAKDLETQGVDFVTFGTAQKLMFVMIEAATGVNFEKTGIERRKMYDETKDRGVSYVEPFASVVLGSVERRSLTDPVKKFDLLSTPLEWTPLCALVGAFSSTIPLGYYKTFKRGIDELIDRVM